MPFANGTDGRTYLRTTPSPSRDIYLLRNAHEKIENSVGVMSGDIRAVPVVIPPADLWRLETIAARKGMTLPEFLYAAALAVAGMSTPKGEESIRVFHRAGMTVMEIARRMNMTNLAVKDQLRRLGLKTNPINRTKRETP